MRDKWRAFLEFIRLQGRRRSRLWIVCVLAALVCFGTAGILIYLQYQGEAESERKVESLRAISQPVAEVSGMETEEKAEDAAGEKEKIPNPYEELFKQNEDMAAWLHVEGTKMDYPVMQTMEDENFYLKRDFYGNKDEAGCLLLDTDSSLYGEVSTNQIIHGHNMKSGTMFGELDLYQDEEYCREHSRIQLFARDRERNYEVIAVFYSQIYYSTDLVFKYYNFFQADTEEQFQYFYDNIKKLSLFDTGVEAEFGDRFITLSTCSYQVEDGRFVVVAKEVEPGPEYLEFE